MRSVDFAATNIPLPVFDVKFSNGESSLEIHSAAKQTLSIGIGNLGYDVGEMIESGIFFPPGFTVHKSKEYTITPQGEGEDSFHPLHTGVFFNLDVLHVDTFIGFEVKITSPTQPNTYKIPVYVNERKVTQQLFELELVVR